MQCNTMQTSLNYADSKLIKLWHPDEHLGPMRSSKLNIEIYIKMYKKDKATVCEVTVQGSSNSVDFKLVKPILGVLKRVQSLKKK